MATQRMKTPTVTRGLAEAASTLFSEKVSPSAKVMVGSALGLLVGGSVGTEEGDAEGAGRGICDGSRLGTALGSRVGKLEGRREGRVDGKADADVGCRCGAREMVGARVGYARVDDTETACATRSSQPQLA